MYFRLNRRYHTTGGATGVRSTSPQTALRYSSAEATAAMPSVATRSRADRPTSAPTQMVVTPRDIAHVEQRLKIVKRNRASAAARRVAEVTDTSPMHGSLERESPAPAQPTTAPPCPAYPVFDMTPLPANEQSLLDELVAECLDVLLFTPNGGASPGHTTRPYRQ